MTTFRYIRWSSLEQGNADRSSEQRQREATDAYASRLGLAFDETLIDSGRSAFTGANLEKGELGRLTQRIMSGAIESPALVVEHLDRLSRRPPADMMGWMMPLLQRGLVVHVAATGQVIDIDKVNHDFGSFVTMMSSAFSAFEFSVKQQERGNAAWKKRRDAAKDGHNISRHRARKWLVWDEATKTYDPIPERVALVEEMFALRIAGYGKNGIAKLFNERALSDIRYQPWSSTSRAPAGWTASAIARIVQDIAVLGYVQYSKFPRGAARRVPLGEPIKVYPAVIDELTFARANTERLANQAKHQGRGREVSNLFGRVSVCAACGGRVTAHGSSRWRINKDGSRSQHYYLYCDGAKRQKTCDNQRGYAYFPIEQAVLTELFLEMRNMPDESDSGALDKARARVMTLEQAAKRQEQSARNILRLVSEGDDLAADEYQAARSRLEGIRKDLAKARAALGEIQGKVPPAEHMRRVAAFIGRMNSADADERFKARSDIKAAINDMVRLTFDPNGQVTASLSDGGKVLLTKDL